MTRIVLLELANRDAEELVRSITEYGHLYFTDLSLSADPISTPAEVAAVVAKPERWCRCGTAAPLGAGRRSRRTPRKEIGYTRGRKYGWWLCSACNRPSRGVVSHFITAMLAGANDLLPQIRGGKPLTPSARWAQESGSDVENPFVNNFPRNPNAEVGMNRRARKRGLTAERRY